jgi:hypothetical protein
MSHHFLQIEDATTVPTSGFRLAEEAINVSVERRAMVVVHGDAGTGKTFAVEHAMLGLEDIETQWLKFPSRSTQKRVVGQLLKELTGVAHGGDRYDMIDEALEVLAEKPRLIIVDEAQELSWEALELLRHLHDDRATQFGLALVGANGCWERISKYPPLESRVLRRVPFVSLSRGDILRFIPGFHPIYENTAEDVIGFVDHNFAKGNLRKWARFTVDAAAVCASREAGAVTTELATAVFLLQRGTGEQATEKPRSRAGSRTRA